MCAVTCRGEEGSSLDFMMRIYFAPSFRPSGATIKQKSNMYTAIAAMSSINNKEIKNQGGH